MFCSLVASYSQINVVAPSERTCLIDLYVDYLTGSTVSYSNFFQLGAYHTIDLELNRPFTIHKDLWDSVALDRLSK